MGCGCKGEKDIPVAKLQDGEAVISEEMAQKYTEFVENIPVRSSNSDLEARIRMLESELQLYKQSYEELSQDYISMLGDEDGVVFDDTPEETPESARETIVLKFIIEAEIKDPDLSTCDIFETFDLNVKDSDKVIAHKIDIGVERIGDQVFIED